MNRVALVTGAAGAIGKAIARQLAAQDGYEVVLACRNEEKAQRAVDEIKHATRNSNVRYELVDVSRRASIQALVDRWQGPLHILINNAATAPRQRQETPEGIELQFAANVLGYFWMTQLFSECLARSAPARVINVASYWAGDLDLSDLEFKRRRYNNNTAYRQSKQYNLHDVDGQLNCVFFLAGGLILLSGPMMIESLIPTFYTPNYIPSLPPHL